MYNNRRNNRFSIFIAAIIVSLLVLLTGCASTKKERYPLSMILMQLSTDNAELKNVLCLLFAVPLMILFCTMVKKIIDT